MDMFRVFNRSCEPISWNFMGICPMGYDPGTNRLDFEMDPNLDLNTGSIFPFV